MDKRALRKPFTKEGRASISITEKDENKRQQSRIEDLGHINVHESDKKEIKESDAWDELGYSFPSWRKWQILIVMFTIQISINLNASLYANGVSKIAPKFGISEQAARVPQLTFLCAYAFGCELWAPWSEELGRWSTQQMSLFLVNIWQIPCALAPNYATLVVCRLLGGLSTAGGSVTLGVVADMWLPDDQEYAVAFLVLSSVGGSVVGPVIGGFLEAYAGLQWIFWTQLIFGAFVQAVHFFAVPETRSTILLDRIAKQRRADGARNIWGPNEISNKRLTMKEIGTIWIRPFYMLFTEPIVAWLSAVSGFSDALIFTFLQGFTPVYKKWGFTGPQIGLVFIALEVGYVLAYFSFLPSIHYFRQKRRQFGSKSVPPEARLWWLRYVILFEPIGLFIFAFTSIGPSYGIPWIAPTIGAAMVAIANYSIYQSSIDYTVAAYSIYAASATGGNDFARDFLSGIAALYSTPMFENIGNNPNWHSAWASLILAVVAILVTTPIFYFYAHGEEIRRNSKFASRVQAERDAQMGDQNQDEKGNSTHHEGAKRRRSRDTEATAVGGDNDGNGNGGGKEGRNSKKTQSPQGMQPAKQRDTPSKRMAYL